jgi:eukaryotic-like serine/threonine-protein kinase
MSVVFQHVGHYEIQHEIGRGGMATVFLATDTRTGQPVALKLVPTGRDREAQEILDAELWGARLQAQFSRTSQHVPAVYEHGIEGPYFYIAMEYLEGRNLSEVMLGGPLVPARAVSIATQLCNFLEAAHGFRTTLDGRDLRSLLHGDLKPRNIRVLEGDEIKVLDFGIAKALSLSRKVTRNDFGSIAYLSPERLESGEIDEHADLWAVGVLLYEMISGVQPFHASDTRRLEQRIRSRRPPPPLDDRCPASLQTVIARLLAPARADRYDSASAVGEELEAFSSGVPTKAELEGWPRPVIDEPPTRRTAPPALADEEATRRTPKEQPETVRSAVAASAPAAVAMPKVAAPPAAKPPVKKRRFLRRALIGLALISACNEMRTASIANRLTGTVPHQELETMPALWERYEDLADGSMNMGLSGLEDALLRQTQLLTDRVAENYKSQLPSVREAQWQLARTSLARAVSLRPRDTRLRGSLRYADGHIQRINGEARKARKQLPEAQLEFANAVVSFREAAEFRPNWPDPFLGLMRTFIYGLEDVDRGAEALKEAQRLGFVPGDREHTLVADSYRARGDSLARMARGQTENQREREYLTRAAESYKQSLAVYALMVGVPSADRNMRAARRALDRVEQRLAELTDAPGLTLEALIRWP